MQLSATAVRISARLSGFLFIWLIIAGLSGAMITARVAGHGTLAQQSTNIINSKHLYGLGLSLELLETMSALLLAFTLYLIARPLNSWIAQLGMYFRMGEAIVGAIGVAIAFAKFHLYTSEGSTETQALSSFFRHAGFAFYNISAIFFSFGSLLFFYIFYKSKAIPRILSVIGIIASPLVTLLCFTGLIYPEDSKWLQLGWAPMAIAEVGTGIWLMIYGIKYKNEQSLAS